MNNFSIALDRAVPDYRVGPDGRLVLSRANDATRDRLFVALSMNTGDWWLDVDDGLPHYTTPGILGGTMSDAEVAARIRRRVLLDPDVRKVDRMDISNVPGRGVVVSAKVTTESGEPVTFGV